MKKSNLMVLLLIFTVSVNAQNFSMNVTKSFSPVEMEKYQGSPWYLDSPYDEISNWLISIVEGWANIFRHIPLIGNSLADMLFLFKGLSYVFAFTISVIYVIPALIYVILIAVYFIIKNFYICLALFEIIAMAISMSQETFIKKMHTFFTINGKFINFSAHLLLALGSFSIQVLTFVVHGLISVLTGVVSAIPFI